MSDFNLWLAISMCSVIILGYIWSIYIRSRSPTPVFFKKNNTGTPISKFIREGAAERIRRRMKK